jgi:hypothetical protein
VAGHWPHKGDPAQLAFDNCSRCEDISRSPWLAIHAMESDAFEAAWARALAWNDGLLRDVSAAEVPVLQTFLSFTSQLAKRGVPWGTVPAGEKAGSAA